MSVRGKDIKIFSCNSNMDVANDIATGIGLELSKSKISTFSDGETSISIGESVRGSDTFIVQSTNLPVNDNLMELMLMCDACKRSSASRITAVIPYFGYARQDRQAKPREPISARLVADLITCAGGRQNLDNGLARTTNSGLF